MADEKDLRLNVEMSLDGDGADEVSEGIAEVFEGAAEAGKAAFEELGETIGEVLSSAMAEVRPEAEKAGKALADAVAEPVKKEGAEAARGLRQVLSESWSSVRKDARAAAEGMKAAFADGADTLDRRLRGLSGYRAMSDGVAKARNALGDLGSWVGRKWNDSLKADRQVGEALVRPFRWVGEQVGGIARRIGERIRSSVSESHFGRVAGYMARSFGTASAAVRGGLAPVQAALGRIGGAASAAAGALGRSFTGALAGARARIASLSSQAGDLFGISAKGILTGIAAFGRGVVQAAIRAEGAWHRLGRTINANGGNIDKQRGRIEAMAAQFERLTRYSREDFTGGLEELTRATGDSKAALDLMSLAAQVASAKNVSLGDASKLLGEVVQGDTEKLEEFGIKTESVRDGLGQLAEKTRGYAEGEAQTLGGQVQQLNNLWGEFQTEVGNAMVSADNGRSVLGMLKDAVGSLTQWVRENKEVISTFAQVLIWVASNAVKVLWTALYGLATLIAVQVMTAISTVTGGIGGFVGALATATEQASRFLSLIGADGLAARLENAGRSMRSFAEDMRRTSEAYREGAQQAVAGLRTQMERTWGGGGATAAPPREERLPETRLDRIREPAKPRAPAAPRAARPAAEPEPLPEREPNLDIAVPAEERERQRIREEQEHQAQLAREHAEWQERQLSLLERAAQVGEVRTAELERARFLEEQLTREAADQNRSLEDRVAIRERLNRVGALREGLEAGEARRRRGPEIKDMSLARLGKTAKGARDILRGMEAGAEATGNKLAGSMADAFGRVLSGASSVGEVLDELWKSMARGALQAIAAKAQGRAGESAADAITETAYGIAAAVTPGRQAEAAGHFASAAQHMAAAAAWSALAGGMGAAASAVGGGGSEGSSSSPRGSRDAGSGVAERADRRGPEIHVYVDGIDPTNPRHQKLTHETMKGIRERYGSDGTVTYAPRRA